MSEENKAIARRWNEEIWSQGKLDAVDELLAPNFVFNYPVEGASPDREGYKQTIDAWRSPYAEVRSETVDIVAEGNKVALHWRWYGTSEGEEMTVDGISILRIEGGKIVEEWAASES